MWPYWLMFLIPAFVSLIEIPRQGNHRVAINKSGWILIGLILWLYVGYRFEVGGDWFTYIDHYYMVQIYSLEEVILLMGDPGYYFLNWVSNHFGGDVFAVNLLCAAIAVPAIMFFCWDMPRPWLALAVSIPYLITIVVMGYSRQGVALALFMTSLVFLQRGLVKHFIFFVAIAGLFHKSALVVLPLAVMFSRSGRLFNGLLVLVAFWGLYSMLLSDKVETLYTNYIEAEYQSQGALIRAGMNAVPALILLITRKSFPIDVNVKKLWSVLALMSLVFLGATLALPSNTTAVDRLNLYIIPIQLFVFTYLPVVLRNKGVSEELVTLFILLYYASVFFVWLNYAQTAFAWVPYRFYPFEVWF